MKFDDISSDALGVGSDLPFHLATGNTFSRPTLLLSIYRVNQVVLDTSILEGISLLLLVTRGIPSPGEKK